jgi:NDP-sugar pyrophosphorylase family protein
MLAKRHIVPRKILFRHDSGAAYGKNPRFVTVNKKTASSRRASVGQTAPAGPSCQVGRAREICEESNIKVALL